MTIRTRRHPMQAAMRAWCWNLCFAVLTVVGFAPSAQAVLNASNSIGGGGLGGLEFGRGVVGMPTMNPTGLTTATIAVGGVNESFGQAAADIGGSSSLEPAPAPPGPPIALGGFGIQLNAGPNLAGNAPALAAFQRAAQQWTKFISDPVTIVINAELSPLLDDMGMPETNIIGLARNALLQGTYDEVRGLMVADANDEPDDGIVNSLPTAAQFSAFLPVNVPINGGLGQFFLNGNVVLSRANAKALEPGPLPASPFANNADAELEFNSNFSFDFDNSDGVAVGLIDLETAASHEIGHALGFITVVDEIDFVADVAWQDPGEDPSDPEIDLPNPYPIAPRTLDLFRFLDEFAASDPDNAAEFTTNARYLVPLANADGAHIFDQVDASTLAPADTAAEQRFSTGTFFGNGRQASHWFPDEQAAGLLIGIMDPTLSAGGDPMFPSVMNITGADLRTLDLIGWDIGQVPEPTSALLALLGLAAVSLSRQRRSQRSYTR